MSPHSEPGQARAPGLAGRFAQAEIALTLAETALVGAPVVLLSQSAVKASGEAWLIGPVLAALLLVAMVRGADALRPVFAARRAKLRGQPLTATEAASAQRAFDRAPGESGLLRWLIWGGATAYLSVRLMQRGLLPPASGAGVAAMGILHAGAAAAARSIIWERILEHARGAILPNYDSLRTFAGSYRRRLCQTALALLGLTHAVNTALVSVFTELSSRQAGMLVALTLPALVIPALLWVRSLVRRTAPIEAYFEAALHKVSSRGPVRDDPRAVQAFRAAQSVPYRLAVYQALGSTFAALAVIAFGRRLAGFDTATAGRLLGSVALIVLAMGLYETLLLRDILRPLLGQLGSRHRLPVGEIRSLIDLRMKLVGFFASVIIFTSGLVLLFALSPTRDFSTMLGSTALAMGLALGLVWLIVRDMVTPIRALEERSDEMARGELARPVPPSGEADEIGRLTFAFEEMRRALRDKLRSTESLNIDLEREVRRRTEVLEQRNGELREALEKLRRAQDDLIRTEKLASMGRLVAGIAHEINNPVNAVINTLYPLQEIIQQIEGAKDLPEVEAAAKEAQEMLRVIERGAARSKAIVQALHNYSRGDEERLRELDLGRSVDDTVDLLRHRLKNIRVEKLIDPDLHVLGFAGQIDQVLMNLVTNAAQALDGNERPEGALIRVAAGRQDGQVIITVADNGPGIPPDVISRVFDPFFTTKDVGEGSGLGLSIVHGIIERHGGRIQVESEVGKGTTFRITLPASGQAAAQSTLGAG
jgi:signal transduction histidine kinase